MQLVNFMEEAVKRVFEEALARGPLPVPSIR